MNPNPAPALITFRPQDNLDRVFAVTVAIKGLVGVLETIGGLLLLVVTTEQVEQLAVAAAGTLGYVGAPGSVTTWAMQATERLSTHGLAFGAAYLLVHRLVKVVLVAALLRNKMWAYPWMIMVLIGFVVFQSYELAVAPSVGLAALTVFDVAVIALTWREYRHQRRSQQHPLPGGGDQDDLASAQVPADASC